MDVMHSLGQSFGLAMGLAFGVLIVFIVGATFYVRIKARGGVYCYLLASNKQLAGYLLKPMNYTVTLGTGDDAKMFLIHPTKQFWSFWPPGFPHSLQVPVPTFFFCDGNAEPLDPYDRKALISPESLRKIADDAMLKMTWKDVKESLGIKAGPPVNKKMILILVILVVAVGAFVYFKFIRGGGGGLDF